MKLYSIKVLLPMLVIMLIGAGCASQKLPKGVPDDDIPEKAEIAIVISSMKPDSLYNTIIDSLKMEGYLLDQSNRNLGAITTRSYNIGKNVQLRMSFLIESIRETTSRMTVRTEWRSQQKVKKKKKEEDVEHPEAIGWQAASWSEPYSGRRAFGYMVRFINQLPHQKISYK